MSDELITIEMIDNMFDDLIDSFCLEHEIKDKYDIYPAQWNAALIYINNNTFKLNVNILKPPVTNGSYNLDAVNEALNIYINKCFMYNQEISITGFCLFTNIKHATIYSWDNREDRTIIYKDLQGNILNNMQIAKMQEGEYIQELSTAAVEIVKKLRNYSEESLVSLLKDRRNNPVKYLAILNRRHSWNMPGVSRENTGKVEITAADIRAKLNDNNTQLLTQSTTTDVDNLDTIKNALSTRVVGDNIIQ